MCLECDYMNLCANKESCNIYFDEFQENRVKSLSAISHDRNSLKLQIRLKICSNIWFFLNYSKRSPVPMRERERNSKQWEDLTSLPDRNCISLIVLVLICLCKAMEACEAPRWGSEERGFAKAGSRWREANMVRSEVKSRLGGGSWRT